MNYDDKNSREFMEVAGVEYINNPATRNEISFGLKEAYSNFSMAADNIDLVSEECQNWLISY